MYKLPTMTQRLTQLIASPSVSSTDISWDQSNRPVIDLLAQWLTALGFAVEILPLKHAPHKANLIATLGQGDGGLVFAGHTDTVPYSNSGWSSSPFELLEKDDKWYGLGTCDMKGFFSVVIEALLPIAQQPLKAPIIIVATADEESSMSGARELVALSKPKARFAVIGEPTNMTPIYKHKSIAMQKITVTGKAGHSSNPELGINAIEIMHLVTSKLITYRQNMQKHYSDSAFKVAVPTMNFGCIHGGDNPNRICASCELHFDTRLLPGMSPAEVTSDIEGILQALAKEQNCNITLEPLINGVEPFYQPLDSTLVDTAVSLTKQQPEAVSFATEAPYLRSMGIDTLVMGPGSIDQAHQSNEFLEKSTVAPAINILQGLIRQFCLVN